MQNMESQFLPPLFNPRTNPPPPIFFFLKKMLRLKINILSSIYPEINYPAKPVMKINNLSRPKVPGPPPLRIKWSSPKPSHRLTQKQHFLYFFLLDHIVTWQVYRHYKEHFSYEFSKRFAEKPTIYGRMYKPKVEITIAISIRDLDLHTWKYIRLVWYLMAMFRQSFKLIEQKTTE